jgi:group II intron reverse transcriptase/maturase/CRISPR-associated endonuclease Cas1
MVRLGYLQRIASLETLTAAWERVRSKAAAGGIDNVTVQQFNEDAQSALEELSRDLLEQRYVPEPLKEIHIPKDESRAERRLLGLLTVRDKIAQEAARLVIEPRLEGLFLDCSYGYRPGKGSHKAIARVTHYITNMKRHWAAIADIDDFFGTIDHERLIDRLRPVLDDEALLRLVALWLKMGSIDPRGRWRDIYSGVNQGGVISPLLANFCLHPFDQSMTSSGFALVRYADDFIILCNGRPEAEKALAKASHFLKERLGLKLNDNPRPVCSLEDGFTFLGIRFEAGGRGIEESKLQKFAAKLQRLASEGSDLQTSLRDMNEAVTGWRRYYGSIIGREGLQRASQAVNDALTRLLARQYQTGSLKTQQDGEGALKHAELVTVLNSKQRRQVITEITRAARQAATARPSAVPQASTSAGRAPMKPQRPRAHHLRKPQPALAPVTPAPAKPASVKSRVSRRRSRHQREASRISELVVNTPGCFIGKTGQRIVVKRERKVICEVPTIKLSGVTISSHGVALSTDVLDHCADKEIPVILLSPAGKVSAVVSRPHPYRGAVALAQAHAVADGRQAFDIAKAFVEGKIKNQRNLMKYYHKYRKRVDAQFAARFAEYLESTDLLLEELSRCVYSESLEASRGKLFSIEGRAATPYWELFGILIGGRAHFPGRQRKGATDMVNSMLNYGYAILQSRAYLALIKTGLAPQISFLHAFQKDKPTLVFDLMEEFRPQAVDRTVLAILDRREKVGIDEQGMLTDSSRRRLIVRINERLASFVSFRGRQIKLDEAILEQARMLAAFLTSGDAYKPFVSRW